MALNHSSDEASNAIIDILARSEARLLRIIEKVDDESIVQDLATLLQDVLSMRIQVELPAAKDQRSSARVHARAMVFMTGPDGCTIEAALHDISIGGALVSCDAGLTVDETYSLEIAGVEGKLTGTIRTVKGDLMHLVFEKLSPGRTIQIAKHIERHFNRY